MQPWASTLLLYAVSRLVSTGLIEVVIHVARPGSRIGRHADLLDVLTAWDGQWYHLIAVSGYPSTLPMTHDGTFTNAWAFLPLYPWLARLLTFGHIALWPVSAVLLSTASGAVAAVLLGLLVRPHVGDRGALVTVALFVLSPVAFLLEATYAEALGLALLFGVLLLIDRRRPVLAIPVVVALAFTRPGTQAVALAVVLSLAVRVVASRRGGARVPRRDWFGSAALAGAALLSGQLWPWIASAVTRTPNAYLDTELAWRTGWLGTTRFEPVVSWFVGADFWFGTTAGPIVLGVLAAVLTAVLMSRPARRAGGTVIAWTLAWTAYLVVVFFPQSSTFRLLMPMAPLGAALGRARLRFVLPILLLSVVLQGVWIFCVYGYWTHYWTVP